MRDIEFMVKPDFDGSYRVIIREGDNSILTWSYVRNPWGAFWEVFGKIVSWKKVKT